MKTNNFIANINRTMLLISMLISLMGFSTENASAAPLSVAPPNDDFSGAIDITTAMNNNNYSYNTTMDNVTTTATPTTTYTPPGYDDPIFSCANGRGLATIWYQYTAPSEGILDVNTYNSGYDTVIAIWTGIRGNLNLVACNDDWNGSFQSASKAHTTSGETYYIEVAQIGGTNKFSNDGVQQQSTLNQLVLNVNFSTPTINTFDDNNSVWTYTGTWTAYSGGGPYNNTIHYTQAGGSYAEMVFYGNEISLVFTKSPLRGLMEIYIDNLSTPVATVNAYSASTAWQSAWSSSGISLSVGNHTLRVKLPAGATYYMDVDAVQVKGGTQSVPAGTYDDMHQAWYYQGAWNTYLGNGPAANTLHYSNVVNNYTEITFEGTKFTVTFAKAFNRSSNIKVIVDGYQIDTINAYSASLVWQATYTSYTLSPGVHTVRFQNPTKGTYMDIDRIQIFGAPSIVGIGTYDDTWPDWMFSPGWATYYGAGPFNGTSTYTGATGSYAEITFSGIQFILTYTKNVGRGLIDVYIDGNKTTTINSGSASLAWQSTWSSPILLSGTHLVRFVHADAGTYIDIDAIKIIDQPHPATAGIYDDTDTAWSYTGNWLSYAGAGPYNNTLMYTGTTGNYAEMQFEGVRFEFTYAKISNSGSITVSIDNAATIPNVTLNEYSASTAWQSKYISPTLSPGVHTVRFVNSGAAGTYINIDAIKIIQPMPVGSYDDTNQAWSYSGTWMTYAGAGPYNNTLSYSGTAGDYAEFVFTGTQFTFVFTKNSYRVPISVSIDAGTGSPINDTIPAYSASSLWQSTYTSPTLSAGTHTVRFTNPGGGYIDVDAIKITDTVGGGSYDDTSPAWNYSGSWTSYAGGGGPYNDTVTYTNGTNDYAEISFSGTQFIFVFTKNSYRGTINVSIDGATTSPNYFTINANNPSTIWQSTITSPVLSPGAHTVRFTNPGGGYIDIDAIIILPLPSGVYDNTYPGWTYSGSWIPYTGPGPYNNTMAYTNSQGAYAELPFTGTNFSFIYTKGNNRGQIEVRIDAGTPSEIVQTIDAYDPSYIWQSVYNSPTLSSGAHTVRFTNLGSNYIDIDAIRINQVVSSGTYDNTHAAWEYSGVWNSYVGPGPYNNTMIYTNSPGANAMIVFIGTKFAVTFEKNASHGVMQVIIDEGTPSAINTTIDAYNATQMWQTTWTSPLLSSGTHTVKFQNNSSTSYIDIDAIQIYP